MVCKEIKIVAVWFVAWSRQFWRFSCVCEEKELVVSPDGGWLSSFHWLFAQFFSSVCDPLTASCRIWMDQSEGEPLKLVRMPAAAQTARTGWESISYGCPLKYIYCFQWKWATIFAFWAVEKSEWVCVCVCVCVCACDGFPGLVGSERRKLMEFSTSKQSLPSNQFNKARLKPTHIHQFWLDRHCDPDACSDGLPKRAEVTSHLFSRVVLVHSHVMGFSWSRHNMF